MVRKPRLRLWDGYPLGAGVPRDTAKPVPKNSEWNVWNSNRPLVTRQYRIGSAVTPWILTSPCCGAPGLMCSICPTAVCTCECASSSGAVRRSLARALSQMELDDYTRILDHHTIDTQTLLRTDTATGNSGSVAE
jgi:hypothetical protein